MDVVNRRIPQPLTCLLLLFLVSCEVHAQGISTFTEMRVGLGFKLFRTLLTAEVKLEGRLDDRGQLPLYLIYRDEFGEAEHLAERLRRYSPTLSGLPVRVEAVSLAELVAGGKPVPAGMYLGQALLHRDLHHLIDYSVRNRVTLFSPYEGDVERGVLAGVSVESRVRPYLNIRTLKQSGIGIKSFFLRVAKHYDEAR